MKTSFLYSSAKPKSERTILLIHGLERFPYTLTILDWRFRRAGWNVLRYRYPCHKASLYDVAKRLPEDLDTLPEDQRPDFAVGYSMGGVILAEALREQALFPRVLLVGSPLLYSQMAALTLLVPGTRYLFGPALLDLAKPRAPKVHPDVQVGTLAGYGPFGKKTSPLLSGANDGLVQVKEAHPEWVEQQRTIYGTHFELVARKKPFQMMNEFFQTGELV